MIKGYSSKPSSPSPEIKENLEKMSLAQKVGQLFMTFFWGETLDEKSIRFFKETNIGNVIFFAWANTLVSKKQVRSLSDSLKEQIQINTGLPPIIAADQEGGFVNRLQKEFTHFPSPMALAATQDPSLARQMGKAIGEELVNVGINFNLAPVVDIYTDPKYPTVNVRSFGASPKNVTTFANAMIEGMEESGILYSLKHAPGYGHAAKDAHEEIPFSKSSLHQLEKTDFYPFAKLSKKALALMTAHLLYPDLDKENIATFSKKILQGLIRGKWEYDGLIISDSLAMNAVLEKKGSFDEAKESMAKAAIRAFLAGCDLMILSKLEWTGFPTTKEQDYQIIKHVISTFIENVQSGVIPMEKIDRSVQRVLTLKEKLPSFAYQDNVPLHDTLALEIAKKGLTILSSKDVLFTMQHNHLVSIFPKEMEKTFPIQETKKEVCYFYPINPSDDTFHELSTWLSSQYKEGTIVVFFSCNGHLYPKQKELVENICDAFPKVRFAIVGLCNPYDVQDSKMNGKYPTYLTYSADPYSIQNVLRSIENREIPIGKIPILME